MSSTAKTNLPVLFAMMLIGCGTQATNEQPRHHAVLETAAGTQEIEYVIEDGHAIYEDDIDLGPVAALEQDRLQARSAGIADASRRINANKLWPNGFVRFRFDAAISASKRQNVLNAVDHYHRHTSITFIEVTAGSGGDEIVFRDNGADCRSALGRRGGTQYVELNGAWCQFGSTVHEIGHALGLIHEHQRKDRDTYVTVPSTQVAADPVNWGAINSSYAFSDYDLQSIMHYGSDQGSITTKSGGYITKNRTELSPLDIQGIQVMYGSEFQPTATTVACAPNRLDVFVRGGDGGVYHKAWDGSRWIPDERWYEPLGGYIIGGITAVCIDNQKIGLFVRGGNSALFYKTWTGTAWLPSGGAWTNLGGSLASQPAAVSSGRGRMDVFVKGRDGQILHKTWNGSRWLPSDLGYASLGGNSVGPTQAVSWGIDRLDVFTVGTDRALYHKAFDGTAWYPSTTGWESLGGHVKGMPAVTSWGVGRLDIVVKDANQRLIHKAWNGAWFPSITAWENLEGAIVGNPAVTSWGPNRLDIFAQGLDGQMYHKAWDGSRWLPSASSYEPLGGDLVGSPSAVSWGKDRLDIFVRGADGALYHKAWAGGWLPSSAWFENLSGLLAW